MIPSISIGIAFHKDNLFHMAQKLKKKAESYGYNVILWDQRKNNQSALVGRKRIIEQCDTEYLWLIDADDDFEQLDFIPTNDCEILSVDMTAVVRTWNDVVLKHRTPEDFKTYPPTWFRVIKTKYYKRAITHYPDMFAVDGEDTLLTYWVMQELYKDNATFGFRYDKPYYHYNTNTSSIFGLYNVERVKRVFNGTQCYDYIPDKSFLLSRNYFITENCLASPCWQDLLDYIDDGYFYMIPGHDIRKRKICQMRYNKNTSPKRIDWYSDKPEMKK